jgi:outer membrane protein assembly factor BamB
VVWQVPAGEGLASPVVARGRVLAFDNQDDRETLRALDAASGKEVWRAAIDEPFTDTQGPRGPRNTPLIDEDRAYAVSCRGELHCRNLLDGSLVWRTSYSKDFGAVFVGEQGNAPGASRHGNDGSPLIDGDHLLAPVGSTQGAGVVCFTKRTGEVIWKSTSDQAGYAPPVVTTLHGEAQVVVYNAAGVVGLRRSDGLERWRFPIKTAFARHVTTPVVVGDTVLVSSHQAGHFAIRITREGDAWSASQAWVSKDAAINFASPVAVDGFLYCVGPARNLVCIEASTGRIQWSQNGVFQTSADKAHGGFVTDGKRVLTLTDSGELVLLAADPQGWRPLGRTQVSGLTWCNPAYAGGVVYLRDGLRKEGRWKAVRIASNN